MAAAATRSGPIGSIIGGIERIAGRGFAERVSALLGGTSLSSPSASPFGEFGSVVAAGSKPIGIGQSVRDVAVFTVEEARERLAAFIDGSFIPDTLNDLIQYLADRFLRIEARTSPSGEVAHYIVDERTKRAVPAAQVDPRLSHQAMLVADLRAAVRPYVGTAAPADAFHSWEGMTLVLQNDRSGIGYAEVGGQGWIGKVHAVASVDPAENERILREAAANGLRLAVPEAPGGSAARGELVPGMPILLRSRSARAEQVHAGLAHGELSRAFGTGLAENLARMGDRARAAAAAHGTSTNVVSMETYRKQRADFRERFARKAPLPEAMPVPRDEDLSFGGGDSKRDLCLRAAVGRNGRRTLVVWDRDLGEQAPIAVRALPPGPYDRENAAGETVGRTIVGRGGATRHLDLDGRAMVAAPRPAAPRPDRSGDEPDRRAASPGMRP